MALNGGKKNSPRHNSVGRTVKNVKFSSTGGSIAKNNTDFKDGTAKKAMPGVGSGISSKGTVTTNPEFDRLHNTGRPASTLKQTNKLPSGMTQQSSKKLPIGNNSYKQSTKRVKVMRGSADSTVSNLKSYLKRQSKGEIR